MRSDEIKKGFESIPHRSLLKATGLIKSNSDFNKPFIGVANSYIDLIPGHVHLQKFGKIAKDSIRKLEEYLLNLIQLELMMVSQWDI